MDVYAISIGFLSSYRYRRVRARVLEERDHGRDVRPRPVFHYPPEGAVDEVEEVVVHPEPDHHLLHRLMLECLDGRFCV